MNFILMVILTLAVLSLIVLFGLLIYDSVFDDLKEKITMVCVVLLCILTVFTVPTGLMKYCTNEEMAYITNYLSQKSTIEDSLQNEYITGYERAALVNKAAELNGELAERKMNFNRWYNAYWDDTIYDDVTPIDFNGKEG